jgi:hypothetical protein
MAKDPVCGMDVDETTARQTAQHDECRGSFVRVAERHDHVAAANQVKSRWPAWMRCRRQHLVHFRVVPGTGRPDICKRHCRHGVLPRLRPISAWHAADKSWCFVLCEPTLIMLVTLSSAASRGTRSHGDAPWRRAQALASARTVDCHASMRQWGAVHP